MPILNPDPWKEQFFEHVPCPEQVTIPIKDYDAYRLYPEHRWAYNKILVAEKQGMLCAPHGIQPPHFPVFSKPIYNLNAMGADSRVLNTLGEYFKYRKAGHMWSELLEGDHISTDVLIYNGTLIWYSHSRGHPMKEGTFDRWDVNVQCSDALTRYLARFVETHFQDFSGAMNFETIGGRIIEMHLRFSDQWPDLYPEAFMQALIQVTSGNPPNDLGNLTAQAEGYSVISFGPHGLSKWTKPSDSEVQIIRGRYKITSIQLAYDAEKPPTQLSMPPGGFRFAMINGFDLKECLRAREEVEELFRGINNF